MAEANPFRRWPVNEPEEPAMKLTRRLLIPTIAFLFIIILLLLSIQTWVEARNLTQIERERLQGLADTFNSRLKAEEELVIALAIEVSNNPDVQAAFAAQDRNALIALTLPTYLQLKSRFGISQYQFHLPPATSFLRLHQPDRYGDDLSAFRQTVIQANANREVVSGLEAGRGGLGVRGVAPVTFQGQHIGTVEFGISVDQKLLDALKEELGTDWQIFLRQEQASLAVEGFVATADAPIPELLLQRSTLAAPLFGPADAYERVLQGETIHTRRVLRNNENYGLLSIPLRDFSGAIIGVVDVIINRTELAQRQLMRGVGFLVLSALLLSVVSISLTWIIGRVLRPVGELTKAAEAIAAGDRTRMVQVNSQDELGALANAFNSMTNQLRSLIDTLEEQVAARTRDLVVSGEVSRSLSRFLDVDQLIQQVVQQVRDAFNFYHVHIYLLDEAKQKLIMAGGTGEAGQIMLARGHSLSVGQGLVGQVAKNKTAVLVPDVTQDANWLPNPLLPDTRSEVAVPIMLGEELLGVLDIQQNIVNGLNNENVNLLQAVATQVAIALYNARQVEATRQSQERLSLVISGTNDGIWDWDIPGNHVYFSPRWKEMLGYKEHEISNDFSELQSRLHPEDHDRMMQAVSNYLEGRDQTYEHEFRMQHKDGTYRWILVRASLTRDAQGAPLRMAGSHTDITERKNAEALNLRRTAQLQAIAEINTQMMAINRSEEMLQTAVTLIAQRFNLSQAHVYLADEKNEMLELAASTGTPTGQLPTTIAFSQAESSVAQAARTGQPAFHQSATGQTELALPLLPGAQVSGALLLVGSPDALTENDVEVMKTLANQLAAVLQSARALEETAAAVARANELTRRLTRSGWQQFAAKRGQKLAFAYQRQRQYVLPAVEISGETAVVQPLTVQGTEIGRLAITKPQTLQSEAAEITAAIAQRLSEHLENLRLTQQTQEALVQTEFLYEGSARIIQASTMSEVLQTLFDFTAMQRMERATIFFFNRPWEEQPDTVVVKATYARGGFETQMPAGARFSLEQFPVAYLLSHDKPVILPDISAAESINNDLRHFFASLRINSLIGLPLVSGDRWFGIVTAQSSQATTNFEEEEIRQIRSLTEQAASVLRTQQLLEEIQGKAALEQMLRAITAQVYAAPTVEGVLRTAAKEVNRILGLETFAYLSNTLTEMDLSVRSTPGNGDAPNAHN